MAGGEVGGAEPVGEREHRVEPHVAVAAHARVRRQPGGVVGEERRDDAGGERRAQVEREVRQPHPVRDRAREPDGVRRAARRLGVVRRRRATARASRRPPRGPSRATSSAATAESTPPLIATSVRRGSARQRAAGGHRRAERDVQRVGGQVGGVQLAGREPAELRRDLRRADPRGVEHRARRATSATTAEPAATAAPQPDASKPGVGDAVAVDAQVDPDEVAAGGAAGRAGERRRGRVAAPAGELQMLREGLGVHAPSVGLLAARVAQRVRDGLVDRQRGRRSRRACSTLRLRSMTTTVGDCATSAPRVICW